MNGSRAVIVAFHKYTPFGDRFYEPIYNSFINRIEKYQKDFDTLYLVDSNWHINYLPPFAKIINVDPHLRYYDAYKEIVKQINEKYVLFMDNDMVVWQDHVIDDAFSFLSEGYDVVSIYDTIGEKTFSELNDKSKFCPYWFCTKRQTLLNYLQTDWGSNLPAYETLGKLTEEMLNNKLKPYEFEEDKDSIYFDGTKDGERGKQLGYYHIRAGSTPAYLLATKFYGNQDTYWKYLTEQPWNEYLRQFAWYQYMGGTTGEILEDLHISIIDWMNYYDKFKRYHGL